MKEYLVTKREPKIINIDFGDFKKDCYFVNIDGKDYDLCDALAHYRWNSKKNKTRYDRGILNNVFDPRKTERTGLLGEFAFSSIYQLPVNTAYVQWGDKYDFILSSGETIDIKTQHKRYDFNVAWFVASDRIDYQINKSIYVISYIANEEKDKHLAEVVFVGWCYGKEIDISNKVKARTGKSGHYNYEKPYVELHDMQEFGKIFNFS